MYSQEAIASTFHQSNRSFSLKEIDHTPKLSWAAKLSWTGSTLNHRVDQ